MLRFLSISDFALVRSLALDLGPGLTILTGETGAGKSIVMDALGLLLGGRAHAESIRDGAEKAVIQGAFDPPRALPEEAEPSELLSCPEVILVRELSRDGRGRATVNGRLTAVGQLRELGAALGDLHGQGDQQSLLSTSWQLSYLDGIAGHGGRVLEVSRRFATLQSIARERAQVAQALGERDRRLALLANERDELRRAKLRPGEEDELLASRKVLMAGERVAALVADALAALRGAEDGDGKDSLPAQLLRLERSCGDIASAIGSDDLRASAAWAGEARVRLREVEAQVERVSESLQMDPAAIDHVESRLHEIDRLRRKYAATVDGLLDRLRAVEQECHDLEHGGQRLQELERVYGAALSSYLDEARVVSAGRAQAARKVEEEAVLLCRDLSLPHARIKVELRSREEPSETAGRTGLDDVELLVALNPGETPRPLRKVASGGEISRVMLALKLLAASDEGPATLVFDEIDTGVSGGAAEDIGRKLRRLGAKKQVLCVTHLPQVACFGHAHVEVTKRLDGDRAVIEARPLPQGERESAIARLLAGAEVTAAARRHAAELLALGQRE